MRPVEIPFGAEADYLRYWQIDQPAFLRPVAADSLFFTASLRASVGRLLPLCRQAQALVLVTGESGTGKSTLLRWLYSTLEVATHEVLLTAMVSAERAAGWLTPRLAEYLGTKQDAAAAPADLPSQMRATVGRLDELVAEHRMLLVAIDMAHLALTTEAVSEVAGYLNLQSLAGPCLSFLLCGDPRLRPLVQSSPELTSRLTFVLEVPRLTRSETLSYIEHRLHLAGLNVPFEEAAVDVIFAESQGILAKINAFCENCLVEACLHQLRLVSPEIAVAAARNMTGTAPTGADLAPPPAAADAPLPEPLPASLPPHPAPAAPPPPGAAPPPVSETAAAGSEGRPNPEASGIKLTSLFKSEPHRKRS